MVDSYRNADSLILLFVDWGLGSRRPGLFPMIGEGIFTQDGHWVSIVVSLSPTTDLHFVCTLCQVPQVLHFEALQILRKAAHHTPCCSNNASWKTTDSPVTHPVEAFSRVATPTIYAHSVSRRESV